MLFASFDFLLFFLPVALGYFALAGRGRWLWLLAASYFFYVASGKPTAGPPPTPWFYVGLLVLSTITDYLCALSIAGTSQKLQRRLWLLVSLSTNLGLLGFFKYSGFLLEVAADLAGLFDWAWPLPTLRLLLPIGISFYTFQSLSYTIDVYRGRLEPERNLIRFAVFVSFFPQLVAGPIVRASEFLPQLRLRLRVNKEDVDAGCYRIVKGLLKKVVLGDFIAVYFADIVFANPAEHSSLENLLALYAFTLQIYADFSGYSDIAIGVARLLGFRLPENFDRPHQARHIGEFWRRWHMTLSTWLRDYLFFPLGGSRFSSARTYFNLWLTMFLVGMWHGASWNFVVYSNLQAAAMLFNRAVRSRSVNSSSTAWSSATPKVPLLKFSLISLITVVLTFALLHWVLLVGMTTACGVALGAGLIAAVICGLPAARTSLSADVIHIFLTFHFTVLSRVFFRAEDLSVARTMVGKLVMWDGLGVREGLFRIQGLADWSSELGLGPTVSWITEWGILLLMVAGLGYHFLPAARPERILRRWFSALPAPLLAVVLAMTALVISTLLSGPRANIYFAF